MSYEKPEARDYPGSPEEWLGIEQRSLLGRLESTRIELAEMEDAGRSERFRLRRLLAVTEERLSNLDQLRQGYLVGGIDSLWQLYEEQSQRQSDVNRGIDSLGPHLSDEERFHLDTLGSRYDEATMDTLRFIEICTTGMEERTA